MKRITARNSKEFLTKNSKCHVSMARNIIKRDKAISYLEDEGLLEAMRAVKNQKKYSIVEAIKLLR